MAFKGNIYITDLEGKIIKQIPTTGDSYVWKPTVYSWNPNGDDIVYRASDGLRKYFVNISSSSLIQQDQNASYVSPLYSPEGDKIAVLKYEPVEGAPQGTYKLIPVIIDPSGAVIQNIDIQYPTGFGAGTIIEWSPKNDSFLIRIDAAPNAPASMLYKVKVDGNVQVLSSGSVQDASWSLDGNKVMYLDDFGEVAIKDVSGSQITSFTTANPYNYFLKPIFGYHGTYTCIDVEWAKKKE